MTLNGIKASQVGNEFSLVTGEDYIFGIRKLDGALGTVKYNTMASFMNGKLSISGDASKYVYGANIARFLKKLKDFRESRQLADCPKIIMIGDSHTNGVWVANFVTWLNIKFGFVETNFERYNYGGQSILAMVPQIEDALINTNPDLVIFGEYESLENDAYLHIIENIIQLVKNRTSADIAIFTWGCNRVDSEAILSGTEPANDTLFKSLNWYRDLAKVYNCELIDTNYRIIKEVIGGVNLDSIYADAIHFNDTGYAYFLDEFKKHFNDANWVENTNITYPNFKKEQFVFFAEQLRFKALIDNIIAFKTEANWTINEGSVASSTANETIIVDIKDAIGFNLKYFNTTGSVKIEVSSDGGTTWVNPSALRFNNRFLQYCTPGYKGGLQAPVKHIDVKNNILTNGVLESESYTIKIINLSPLTAEVFNSSNVSLGTFQIGVTDLITADLDFLKTYNKTENFVNNYAAPYTLSNTFTFKVKSNWIDTVDLSARNSAKVFGFARGDYKVRLTLLSGSCKLLGLNIKH